MRPRTLLVVHRTGSQIMVMLPYESDSATRHFAIVNEDEAYCLSSAMRRMATTRDNSVVEVGEPSEKLRIEHVDHVVLPFEIVFEHNEGTIIVDLRRDEALTLADMLWGAHRGPAFYMSTTLVSTPRRREPPSPSETSQWAPDPSDESLARLLANTHRRVRGQPPKSKS